MECLSSIINIFKSVVGWLLSSSEELKNITDIIVIVIGGVCAIKGFNYLKSLKEKKMLAMFGFWTHLSVKIIMLEERLSKNPNIINNLYSEKSQKSWGSMGAPAQLGIVDDFLKIATDTLEIIKQEENQIPAYKGWTEDYLNFIRFLDDIFRYDILDPKSKFKFNESCYSIKDRNEYCDNICSIMRNIIEGIKHTQKKTEKKLYK